MLTFVHCWPFRVSPWDRASAITLALLLVLSGHLPPVSSVPCLPREDFPFLGLSQLWNPVHHHVPCSSEGKVCISVKPTPHSDFHVYASGSYFVY